MVNQHLEFFEEFDKENAVEFKAMKRAIRKDENTENRKEK